MKKNSVRLIAIASCMLMGMSLVTACGNEAEVASGTTEVSESASEVQEEIKEDITEAKEDVEEVKEEVSENVEKASEEVKDATSDDAEEEHISMLPDYIYKGGDPYISAISMFMIENYAGNYERCDVSIPNISIIDIDDSNADDILVWGDYWIFNYDLDGDKLVCKSGGNYPGLIHIKDNLVTGFDIVADGSDYTESAKAIFGDRYEKFEEVNASIEEREKIRTQTISDYVKSHELNITKYQDEGWDPVTLPE